MKEPSVATKITSYGALCASGIVLLLLVSCAHRAAQLTVEADNQHAFPETYVIGPADVLEVLVWKNEALSRVVTVRPDGNFSLPLIGDVQAAGLTPAELKEQITEKVKVYYKDVPEVSVIVQQPNSSLVYILGEVQRPGSYPLLNRTTLLQAITSAGGFTSFASTNKITVIRGVNSDTKIMKIRYNDIISGERPDNNILMLSGDVIIIP
jgi:polysaccharide biosynthesis/export protein